MPTTRKIAGKLARQTAEWREKLAGYTEEEFARKPGPAEWSAGQLYYHLTRGTENFHLHQIQKCINRNQAERGGKKTGKGRVSLFFGRFPPIRISVPPSERYTPKQPDLARMEEALIRLADSLQRISEAVSASDPEMKAEHPAFGFLNAAEWYHLISMHFDHHLSQRKRLNRFLGKK